MPVLSVPLTIFGYLISIETIYIWFIDRVFGAFLSALAIALNGGSIFCGVQLIIRKHKKGGIGVIIVAGFFMAWAFAAFVFHFLYGQTF